jgi:RNA polymerase sigma-70 factor, ECF subfamily
MGNYKQYWIVRTSNAVNSDDRRLIEATLSGQTAAFGELVRRHQDRLYNAVLRVVHRPEDAADVVQDALVNAYQNLASFKGDAEFFTWLYRIAFNAAISWRRKQRGAVSLTGSGGRTLVQEPADSTADSRPGDALERREDEARLEAALRMLSADHRQVIVLKDLQESKYDEIAEILRVPIGTVRSRLSRARLELRAILERLEGASQTQQVIHADAG